MTSRWGVVTVLVMLLAAVLVFEPATAVQQWSPIQVSRDGRAWSSRMAQPLFAAPVALVPGSQRDASFQVRNSSSDTARLKMHLVAGGDWAWWARSRTASQDHVRIYLRTGNGPWRQIMSRSWIKPALTLRPGQRQGFQVRVALPEAAKTVAQKRSMTFSIRLRLTQQRKGR